MYFIEQIRQQFILTLSAQNGEGSSAAIDQHYEANSAANDNTAPAPSLSVIDGGVSDGQQGPQTAETLAFQELNEELDGLDNDSGLVNTYTNILGNFLVKVRNGEIEGLSEDDSDFQRLLTLYRHKFEELKDMRNRGQEIEHVITQSMGELNQAVDKGAAGEDIDEALDAAYEEGIKEQAEQERLEGLNIQRNSYQGVLREQLGEYTQEQQDNFGEETKQAIAAIESINSEDVPQNITIEEQITKITDINQRLKDGVEGLNNFLGYESQLITRNNHKATLGKIEEQFIKDGGHKVVPDEIKVALNVLFEENLTGNIVDNTTRITEINIEIGELMGRVNSEVVDAEGIFSRVLTEEEITELTEMRTSYQALKSSVGEKLSDYLNSEVVPEPFDELVSRYNTFDEEYDKSTDSQEYDNLKAIAIPQLEEFDRIVDIALRDEGMVGPNGERLGQLRLEGTNEAYNKILENAEVKDAITSNAGETPTFEQLDMNHIHILKEKGVNLAELFLVHGDGTSFSGTMQQGESYIINFGGNQNLPGKLDFAFLTHDVEQISIDGAVFTFDEATFNKDPASFAMRDGSKIEILKLFGDDGQPSETQREAAIDGALEQYATSATQRQAVREALQSNSPNSAFEGDTLPKGILGAIIAMILNYGDGRNFKYDPETGTWKEGEEEATNNDMIASSQGNYTHNGQSMDMSGSFENLDPGVGGLVNIVYQAEAGGNPNIIYSGCRIRPPRPITEMTVRELQIFQDEMVAEQNARGAKNVSSAIGACQVIRSTLDAAVNSGLLDLDEKFDVDAQMRFTIGKMNERGLSRFQSGAMSEADFMTGLSQEWASLPKDMGGASYYNGHAGNRALVSPDVIRNQLRQIKAG